MPWIDSPYLEHNNPAEEMSDREHVSEEMFASKSFATIVDLKFLLEPVRRKCQICNQFRSLALGSCRDLVNPFGKHLSVHRTKSVLVSG